MRPVTRISASEAATSRLVAEALVAAARRSRRKHFDVALAGGSTPRAAYQLLAVEPLLEMMPWKKVRIFFGDERHVPHDDPRSNYRMAREAFLDRVPIPAQNVFPVPSDAALCRCAQQYEQTLRKTLSHRRGMPVFDLVVLGIGSDGHTASLLPGTPAVNERQRAVTTADPAQATSKVDPRLPRITLTAPVIWNARAVWVLAKGAEKAKVVAATLSKRAGTERPVASLVREGRGQLVFWLDKSAAALL